ncbi:hypothetical protein Q8F55_004716 [Vanrija albida]|uniref:Transmembrane protein n=1 Tax=Vanrija albida TaxID=181172 RepID=A0ABR3PZM0_9TREE
MTTRHLACALLLIPATLAFKPTLWFNTSFTDLDGWWNYGPQPSYWVVSELAPHGITTQGPSWHSTNRTAVQLIPAVANVALYASWARINISVEECPTTLMLAVDRRLQGPLPLWTTTTCTTGNWTLNLGRSPIADVYNATLSVYNGSATIYSVEQTVGIQTQQTDITQLLLVTIPIINSTRLNPLYSWNGDWSVSPFNDPFSGAVQTAAGGSSSSVVIPIPANTSFVLMQGVRSATNADGFVDFDPPAPYGKTIQFWSQGAAPNGMTLFSTSLDPTVLYSMTVRAGRGYIGLYYTQYISGLIDNSNWPVLNRSSTASAAVTGSTVVTSSHASTSATTSPASNSNASTNLGALIGGLVAGIIAVVAVIIITVLYRRATRRSSKPVALDPVDLADMRDEHSHLTPFTHVVHTRSPA